MYQFLLVVLSLAANCSVMLIEKEVKTRKQADCGWRGSGLTTDYLALSLYRFDSSSHTHVQKGSLLLSVISSTSSQLNLLHPLNSIRLRATSSLPVSSQPKPWLPLAAYTITRGPLDRSSRDIAKEDLLFHYIYTLPGFASMIPKVD